MTYFAVIDNALVINTITADSKENAELVVGKTCVEFTLEQANPPHIGLGYDGTIFEQPPAYQESDTLEERQNM